MSTHYIHRKGGKWHGESLRAELDGYPDGTAVEVNVRKAINRRSSPQNRYFHGVVLSVAVRTIREMGTPITPEQLKEAWKLMFAPVDVPTTGGMFVTVGKSTAEMDVDEFTAFVDNCVAWCAEQGIVIPPAGEQTELELAA